MSKKNAVLVFAYLVFLIITVEGSSRLVFLIPQASVRLWEDEDYGWRRKWVSRHQDSGREINYAFDIYDSSKGWISKPNLRNMNVYDNKVLNTNSKGLRGKGEYSYDRNPKKVRIVLLGDSFTFGDEVNDNETYAYYLQEMLPDAEVINMGVHGYGHDQMLIFLREEGIKYKPDIVILGFLHSDMHRNLLGFRDYAKPRFVLDKGRLHLTGTPVPRPEDMLKWDWTMPRTLHIFSIIRHRFLKSTGWLEQQAQDVTAAILTELINTSDSVHATPIFVHLPTGTEIANRTGTSLTQAETFLFSICERNDKVRCISAWPHFAEKIAKGTIFESKWHLGPKGHLTVAEAINRYLVDEGYVAPRRRD